MNHHQQKRLGLMDAWIRDHCSPTQAPLLWIVLNGACCIAAALVFFLATFKEHLDETTQATYILYNFVVCLIWFLQAGLLIRYPISAASSSDDDGGDAIKIPTASSDSRREEALNDTDGVNSDNNTNQLTKATTTSWQLWLEFAVATYFLVDCAVAAYRWHLAEIHAWHVYLDTVLDFSVYVYYLTLAIQTERRHWKTDDCYLLDEKEEDATSISPNSSTMLERMEAGEVTGTNYVQVDDHKRTGGVSEVV